MALSYGLPSEDVISAWFVCLMQQINIPLRIQAKGNRRESKCMQEPEQLLMGDNIATTADRIATVRLHKADRKKARMVRLAAQS